jgi:hypothetical protein
MNNGMPGRSMTSFTEPKLFGKKALRSSTADPLILKSPPPSIPMKSPPSREGRMVAMALLGRFLSPGGTRWPPR